MHRFEVYLPRQLYQALHRADVEDVRVKFHEAFESAFELDDIPIDQTTIEMHERSIPFVFVDWHPPESEVPNDKLYDEIVSHLLYSDLKRTPGFLHAMIQVNIFFNGQLDVLKTSFRL